MNGLREWAQPPEVAPHFRGAFATHYLLTPDHYFYRVSDGLSDTVVAGANCGLSQVLFALDRVNLAANESIVIQGAGGLGLYASAVAKDRGARVIVIDGVPDRLALARRFGADAVVDMGAHKTIEDRLAEVQRYAGGDGADVVLELTGVAPAFGEALGLVRIGGRVVSMGNLNVGAAHEIPFAPGALTRKNATVIGCLRYDPWYLHHALSFLEATGDRYPYGALTECEFPLSRIEDAIASGEQKTVARASVVMSA